MSAMMGYGSMMGGPPPGDDFVATAGDPLPEGAAQADDEAIYAALRTVYDPEIPVNIYDLGLIYEVERRSDGSLHIDMSLTAPGCPVAGTLPGEVAQAAAGVEGVGEVEVRLVWEPPWTMERMSEDARLALGLE